jgi:hypothetical protein
MMVNGQKGCLPLISAYLIRLFCLLDAGMTVKITNRFFYSFNLS